MNSRRDRLKSKLIKDALTGYIVPPFNNSYQVCAVRTFWKDRNNIWSKRRNLKNWLNSDKHGVEFFSCITAQQETKSKKRKRKETDDSKTGKNDPFDSTDTDAEVESRLSTLNPRLSF